MDIGLELVLVEDLPQSILNLFAGTDSELIHHPPLVYMKEESLICYFLPFCLVFD